MTTLPLPRGVILPGGIEAVRALRDGRKTMFRTPVKLNDWAEPKSDGRMLYDLSRAWVDPGGTIFGPGPYLKVPFAHPAEGWAKDPTDDTATRVYPPHERGEMLWVKERWAVCCLVRDCADEYASVAEKIASESKVKDGSQHLAYAADGNDAFEGMWRSPAIMPRWAARTYIGIVSVRVERVQEISEEDARAEGATYVDFPSRAGGLMGVLGDGSPPREYAVKPPGWSMSHPHPNDPDRCLLTARFAFGSHFDSLHGPGSWEANSWVWVYGVKMVEGVK